MAKKNRFVVDVPGETAEDRLGHYLQQAEKLPGKSESKSVGKPARSSEHGPEDRGGPKERTFVARMLGVGVMGWVQLLIVCVAVGAVAETSGINPFAPNFSLGGAATAAATASLNVLGWAMTNGWRPLLTGAIVVLPVWLVWRLVSSSFRR
jgi:hypothetical protein